MAAAKPSASARTGKVRSKQQRLTWLRQRASDLRKQSRQLSEAVNAVEPSMATIDAAYQDVQAALIAIGCAAEDWNL